MNDSPIPVTLAGPGSQPVEEDGIELDFLAMPADMTTFSAPIIPEPEELENVDDALQLCSQLLQGVQSYSVDQPPLVYAIAGLDEPSVKLIDQMLGNGEVSIKVNGATNVRIQESALAGIWRVHYVDEAENILRDVIEVASIPSIVKGATFNQAVEKISIEDEGFPDGVINAPPLLIELNDRLKCYQPADPPHAINLTLLPQTDEDLSFLANKLGTGPTVILSRGYGNCRVSSTGTQNIWWVQYFNSQDANILNTLEVSEVPEVAQAAQEDIDDSAVRLAEMLEIYL